LSQQVRDEGVERIEVLREGRDVGAGAHRPIPRNEMPALCCLERHEGSTPGPRSASRRSGMRAIAKAGGGGTRVSNGAVAKSGRLCGRPASVNLAAAS
jgi:hypothetical protein